jgi:(4S)-4-hydroxy-5-phosphonooxypentane-2,3-dione isomerase
MYVVIVHFSVVEGAAGAFREAIFRNAAASLEEPGCRQFDVCFSEDGGRCFLYELYDDRAAYDFHLTTPHFKVFDEVGRPLFTEKRVDHFLLAENPLATLPHPTGRGRHAG